MNRARKRTIIIITAVTGALLAAMLLILSFVTTHDGVILEVHSHHDIQEHPSSIWVVEGSPNDIAAKTEDELREIYAQQGTVFDLPQYLPDAIVEDLAPGQEVTIYFSGVVEESGPAGAEAYWLTASGNQRENESQ